jgi:hypothetical protein
MAIFDSHHLAMYSEMMKRRKRKYGHNITLFRVFCLARPGPALSILATAR